MRKIILLTPLLALFSLFTFNAFGADITCSAGEFLNTKNECETCWANYYCKGGTWTPDDKEHGLDQCPTTTPYSNSGAKSEKDCYAKSIDCGSGYYLPKGSEKCTICPSGSYCIGLKGAMVDTTKDQGIEKCPSTAPYSKSGTPDEKSCFDTTTCNAGEFLPAGSYSDCKTCPVGSYCKGGKYPYNEKDDQGLTQCPVATPYSNDGAKSEKDCYAQAIDCKAGYYVVKGENKCTICPVGSYCSGIKGASVDDTKDQGIETMVSSGEDGPKNFKMP